MVSASTAAERAATACAPRAATGEFPPISDGTTPRRYSSRGSVSTTSILFLSLG